VHVPDGYLDAATTAGTAAVAAAGIALALRGSRRELDERTAPMAGLTAAFVFAVQMMNFPVAYATSGHLIGGALTAVLVGPWTAVLCMTVVLLVQALVFADGGLTALGTNVTLMGLVAIAVGYGVFTLLRKVLPASRTGVLAAAGVGAFLSVPVAAMAFVGLFAIGGVADVSVGAVAAAMGGVHLLIGLGEGVITVAVLGAVLAVRPDLVRGARHLQRTAALAPRPDVAGRPATPVAPATPAAPVDSPAQTR